MSPHDTELQEVIFSMRQLMNQTQQLLLQYAMEEAKPDVLKRGQCSMCFQDKAKNDMTYL